MSSFIHGWRVMQYTRCSKTGAPVLQGSAGMHLHTPVQRRAECRGISGAMWMTEKARERLAARSGNAPYVPHDDPAPDWDCTCGSYFYRTFADAWVSDMNAYAHVTCLERTMLHKNGGRTTQYSVDYLLAPPKEGLKVYLPITTPEQAQGNPVTPGRLAYGPYGGFYGGLGMVVERDQKEVLEEVALSLGVPILSKDDLSGCPVCLVTNLWREPEEITPRMYKDWFGAGYK